MPDGRTLNVPDDLVSFVELLSSAFPETVEVSEFKQLVNAAQKIILLDLDSEDVSELINAGDEKYLSKDFYLHALGVLLDGFQAAVNVSGSGDESQLVSPPVDKDFIVDFFTPCKPNLDYLKNYSWSEIGADNKQIVDAKNLEKVWRLLGLELFDQGAGKTDFPAWQSEDMMHLFSNALDEYNNIWNH